VTIGGLRGLPLALGVGARGLQRRGDLIASDRVGDVLADETSARPEWIFVNATSPRDRAGRDLAGRDLAGSDPGPLRCSLIPNRAAAP
jgi:hypothetical protein